MRKKFPWKLGSGYRLFGEGTLGAILGERFESIYPHMKMYFYAYLAVSAIDYFTHRRRIPSASCFWNARMLVAASFPWMSIVRQISPHEPAAAQSA